MKKLKLNELNRVMIDEYSKQEKFPVVIVLDNIRSAMNVGSFFRTADGFGIEKIYICGISACPPHKEISKTAIGADHSVEWEYVTYGPTTVKHIYSKVPNYYPTQKISRPINTLYGHDFSEFHTSGVGNGKRIGYGYKPYPFTNTNNRERRIYADYLLPYMDIRNFTKYPVIRGGPTLDSPLQKHPFPYYKP